MKKLYATIAMAMMALSSMAQEPNDTTYVMMDFTQNIWNYPVREVTKGWTPDYKDWDSEGAILDDTDFSWPIDNGSTEKVKVTVYSVDLDEYEKASVYASYELNEAETAALGINAGKTNMLYTQPGTTMRFEAPEGYRFGKMVFYNYRNANFLVGDEYEEEFEYEYDNTVFKQKLKVWTPASPKVKEYPEHNLRYDMWEGDAKNILFNYPNFSAVFVRIDVRLVPDETQGISDMPSTIKHQSSTIYDLQGRRLNMETNSSLYSFNRGIYVLNGKKVVK